jgi:LPXTG-motif cell wall-anchored protein
VKRPVLLATAAALVLTGLAGPAAAQEAGSSFTAQLSGSGEIPPGDPDGTGTASVVLRGAQLCWSVTISGVAPVTAGHVHRGGEGVAGPVVVPLLDEPDGLPTEERYSNEETCVDADAAVLEEIRSGPGGFYVNFHNAEFPGGAVRGQLVAGSLPFTGTTATELALAGGVLVAAGSALLVVARRRRAA